MASQSSGMPGRPESLDTKSFHIAAASAKEDLPDCKVAVYGIVGDYVLPDSVLLLGRRR
jgi:hypothetical protein